MFLIFFFFLLMENLGAMAYSQYTGFREITDRDVLELHCIKKIKSLAMIALDECTCNRNSLCKECRISTEWQSYFEKKNTLYSLFLMRIHGLLMEKHINFPLDDAFKNQ